MDHRPTTIVGRKAEDRAFVFLKAQQLTPVARNFRGRGGEIDLIMLHDDLLVFIEVRSRGKHSFARAAHTVDVHKQRKLIRTAALFIARRKAHANRVMRFDVVGIDSDDHEEIEWIRDAFRPTDSRC